ncbi:MAG: ribosome biogenesis GTPase Der [Acidimicrobiia bacterium]|nr:ribosome biogenesis GTPase Der [Acidimicrobiia bacterium]
MDPLPVVAVVGRPNIGKSTLVNRIIGRREAVVEEKPGVTRDRREFRSDWAGRDFLLIDTGGWQVDEHEHLAADISAQAEAAVGVADVVVFVIDATTALTDDDTGIARLVRPAARVVVAANKVDSPAQEDSLAEVWKLGLGQPFPVSALHGRGVGDLLDAIVEALPDVGSRVEESAIARLAIVGRPNVGKSTLLNRMVGEERVLVSPVPGTTRDPIDVTVEIDGTPYVIVDTAGMRRTPKLKEASEFYSVQRAKRVLADADVALLVIDATEGVTQQDQRIAEEAAEAGTALVIVANKWDIADEDARILTERTVGSRLGFVGWAPLLRMSAKTGARTHRIGKTVAAVLEASRMRIPTGQLNRLVREWTQAHPPPVRKGRRPKVLYAVQAGIRPPTIILFVSGGELGNDYVRFIENRLRTEMDFTGTPVHVRARRRSKQR